jgi:twitching motility protein PilT
VDRLAHPGGAGPGMPVATSLELILQEAVQRGASDVHIKTCGRPAIRVAGSIARIDVPPPSEDDVLDFVQAALGRRSLEEFLRRRELDDSVQMAGCAWRLHAYWCSEGPAVAARRLRDAPPSMDEIGIPEAVREWAGHRAGLVIVSGPTGAGKSTTLSAIVNHINLTRACHIVTIEDPIEYRYPQGLAVITQRQVGRDTEDFATALRAVVRGDPDVILIGEMRDPESMRAALSIAEAGHLVLATLHTASAVEVPSRIVDALPASDQAQARVQLASSLLGVVTQVLLPRATGRQETDPLKQRVAAFEVMAGTPGCRALIRSGSFHQLASQIQIDAEHGSVPMEESLARLAAEGVVEEEVARAAALRPQEFDQRLRRLQRTVQIPSG